MKYSSIVNHYESCFDKYGDSHQGVDWPNEQDAITRYKAMLNVIDNSNTVSLLDFGCGLSHLYEFIEDKDRINYSGLDISKKFIDASKQKYPNNNYYCLDILNENEFATLPKFDYVIANGVFTEKRDLSFEEMFEYVKEMLLKLFELSKSGLAFNVMSKQVDWERDDLFHLPFDMLADFLCSNVTRNFVFNNSYGLYEYTTYVYR